MNLISRVWTNMGLSTRLVAALWVAVAIALGVSTVLTMRLASQEAHKQLNSQLQENFVVLSQTIATSLQSQRYSRVEELLNEHLLLSGIKAVEFRSDIDSDALVIKNEASIVQTAPDWFVRLCNLTDRKESRPVEIESGKFGQVSLTISPMPVINSAWEFLQQQVAILIAGASIVLFGIWLALRSNLKPIAMLAGVSRALERGDFSQRMPITGSREFRTTFQSFNAMADGLEHLVNILNDSQRTYATLVETAPVGVFQTDMGGNPTFANRAMRQIVGLHGTDMSLETWFSRTHPDDREWLSKDWARMRRDSSGGTRIYRYLGAENQGIWVQVQVEPIVDEAGQLTGFVGTATDITAERNLRAQTERLSRLYATLSQVNSAIIHCTDEQQLYDAIGSTMVEQGGFSNASVSIVDWTRRKAMLVTSKGKWTAERRRDLAELDLDDPESRTLTNMTLLSGTAMTANDIQNDERISPPFREILKNVGAKAASTVVFSRFGETVATLVVISDEQDFFRADLLALIEEVGRDVSFALENFSRERKRKQAEQAVVKSEQNLGVTLRSIGDAVLVTDNEGQVTMMNPVAEELTGWSEDDARGRPAGEVFHIINQETRHLVVSPIDMVLRDGKIVGLANHTVLIAKDGTERPIADSGAPIRYGDDGEVNGVVLVFRDQSDEYRMLKALRDSEQLYSQLVGAAPVGIFQTDARGMVVFANDVLLNMAGVSRDDMSPERWAAAYHPDDREQVGKAWIESVRSLVPAEATTYRYVRPDGRQTWAQARAIPLLDDKGELNGYVGVVTDITTERQQLQKIERISRLYATLSQVNSAIAHTADRDSLYREICRVIVDAGGFSSAAITHVNWQTRKSWPVISSGTWEGDYKTLLPETDLDDPTWVTVSRMALLSGAQVTVNDMTTEERISPQLRAWALARAGIASSAVPLRTAGQIIGALGFASNEKGFFTAEIIRLIDDIGRDVSFALENIESAAQKQLAEAAVMRSEQNLNVTLRSIGDAVLVTDNEGQVTMMNPIAEELTGWSENDARGRPAGEVFHIINEETRHLVTSPIDMVLRDGKIVGLANHTVLIAKDGTERPIADSGAPIRYGDDGEVNGVVLVFRDQSDEHRMLKALRESEQHYSTLVKTAPVGVFHADLEGNTTYSNTTMLAIAGMDKPILSLQEWAATIHPQDRDHVARKWQEAVKTRSGITVAYRYLHADGNVIWSRTSLAPVFDDKQVFTGFIGAVVDITPEQNHLREIEMLSRLYETLSQVSAAIVRSPDEQSLYDAVCAIMVEKGGFARAGVTRPDWDRRKSILVSDASPGQLALDHGFIELDMDGLQSQNLTTLTLLSGIAETANDIRSDDRIGEIFQKLIGDVDARSASTVAFTCFGEVASVLTLTSSTKDFFTEDILRLIGQVARDISHALENIESEKKRKQAEAKLTYNEERLRMGLHVTNIGMYEVDFTTNRIRLDATSCQLMNLGSEAQEFEIAEFVKEAFPEEESQIILQLQRDLLNGKRDEYFADSPLPLPGGTVRWLRNQGAVTGERTADGRPIRFLGVISDITTTKELEERDEFAATVFENSGESIIVIDAGNKVVMVNRAFTRISGYSAAEILGVSARIFRTDRHHAAFYSGMKEELLRDGAWHGEIWRRRKTGEEYPTLMTISVIRDKKGGIAHFVVQEIDISAQKEFEQRISHLAYRDALTDLPNRTLLRDRVDQSIAVAHREGNTLALLFLDLDHFKNINDSLGHAVGDHLLKEIALRLTGSVRETDTVGRLGGDEFLLLLPDADADAAAHVALKLIEECVRPFAFESHSLTVTPSIGIALYPKDGSDFNELLKSADTAMYRAKDDGRNAYRFYTPEMNQAVFQRMVLESSLRRAIEKNEFVLHYQPKFSLQNDALVGVEALIRWHQPELGTISPAQFIPVAEESGLIEAIGTWVLEEACRQVKAWQDDGLPALRVAVNFSARQFASRNIAELVSATLKKTGVSGAQLEMEITESLLAQDMDYTLEVLHSLKKLGVHVAVDDFGTGYSSLSYLKRFPIDRLKIDQSFVRDLVTDPDDRAIATAIVTLGHSLDIRVIAEGVETVRQLEILREMGCDEAQGYYLGRPIPASEMAIALRRFAAMPSREA